jgi:hypothetical protein
MATLNAVKAALHTKLTGGTALTALLSGTAAVYEMQGPRGGTAPYVIYQKQAGSSAYTLASGKATDSHVFLVKAVTDEPSAKVAGDIREQIDLLLDRGTLTITGGTALLCRREVDVEYHEISEGRRINHVGATYRIEVG